MNTGWVVKGSKFCNMRCAYCYEWDELDSKDRIPLDLWRKIFVAMKENHANNREAHLKATTDLILHGGEPLVLPAEYREAVMATRDEIFGSDPAFTNTLQTNLLQLTEEHLDWLERNSFGVGVSFDMVPGVRLGLGGRETERTVRRNMDRLRERGISFGVISVLAKHTIAHVTQLHDFLVAQGISHFSILPLFPGPDTRPEHLFATTEREIDRALDELFRHWIETGMRVRITPFTEHLETTLRKMVGVGVGSSRAQARVEPLLVVNTNGELFTQTADYSPAERLGDLSKQTFTEILSSSDYKSSLDRRNARLSGQCSGCEYERSCNGWPALADLRPPAAAGRCAVAYNAHKNIERYLLDAGFEAGELLELLEEGLSPVRGQAAGF